MSSITLDGTDVSYSERGVSSAGKPPLVLLHGFPLDQRMWEAQLDALSAQRRVITPDLPGFGQSRSDKPFTIASLADAVHTLLEKLDALPCVLGGLSMGGYVALAYSKTYPKDLAGLLLIDTRAEADTSEGKAGREKMIELVQSKGAKAVAEQMLPKMLATDAEKKNPQVAQRLREIMEACPAKTIENALIAMRDREDYCTHLPSIAVPTLILVGEQDAITPPKMAETMNHDIPRSTLVKVANAGHMTPMEQPEQVNMAITQFLSKL